MEWLSSPEALIALVTLTLLEIVLGIDNVIFIAIVAGKLPAVDRERARKLGLTLAMVMRIALLASIAWIARLTTPLVSLFGFDISGRDLILIIGGLFLTLPLAWRRRAPLAVIFIFVATGVVNEALDGGLFSFPAEGHSEIPPFASLVAGVVAFYSLGAHARGSESGAGLTSSATRYSWPASCRASLSPRLC